MAWALKARLDNATARANNQRIGICSVFLWGQGQGCTLAEPAARAREISLAARPA
jgi:hypothetical protein